MSLRTGWWIVIILFVIIVGLALVLFLTPPSLPNQEATSVATSTATTTIPISPQPLSAQVSVATPQPNRTVAQTFTVSGIAPNAWYFEAVFPIQVRDPSDNIVGRGEGQAQSDWTTPGPVPFSAIVHVENNYQGPATLILNKDNPSGLPENADEVTIPIVIQ